MALDTKLNLNNNKFEQSISDVLSLSGCTTIYGNLNSINGYQISGSTVLKSGTAAINSIYLGKESGNDLTNVGTDNNVIGFQSLFKNESGSYNSVIGGNALYNNTIGSCNTSMGYLSGFQNITGSSNVFIGKTAGYNETTSNKLYVANTAACNLIYGDFVTNEITLPILKLCTTPQIGSTSDSYLVWNSSDKLVKRVSANTALTGATNGLNINDKNVELGGVLNKNTTINNTGYTINILNGYLNTTNGYQISGSTILNIGPNDIDSIFIGKDAGHFTGNTGIHNVGVGSGVLYCNTVGSDNTSMGYYSLISNKSGSSNVAIGHTAGFSNVTGSSNVFIGTCAGCNELGSNKLYIANNASCNLIYGDFLTNEVTLPKLKLCTTPSNGNFQLDKLLVWNTGDTSVKLINDYFIVTGVTNLGTGANVYDTINNYALQFNTLVGSGNTSISNLGNNVVIYTSGGTGTLTGATNLGTGNTIYTTTSNKNIQLKSLKGVGGISVTNDSNHIIFSGGSTTIPYFDATVGVTGQYADIAAAQTAGKYRLKAVGNITMSGNTTISNNIYLDLNGYTMNCSSYNFINGSKTLIIEGNLGLITFANIPIISGSYSMLFEPYAIINNATITNASTLTGQAISNTGRYTNCIINLPNTLDCGFGFYYGPRFSGYLNNVIFQGGGANCSCINSYQATPILMNLTFNCGLANNGQGTFITSCNGLFGTTSGYIYLFGYRYDNIEMPNAVIFNVLGKLLSNIQCNYYINNVNGSTINNISTPTLNMGGTNGYVMKIVGAINITTIYNLCKYSSFVSSIFSSLTITDTDITFSDCLFTGNVVINGDYHKINNCIIVGLTTLSAGAEYNTITSNTLSGGISDLSSSLTNEINNNIG